MYKLRNGHINNLISLTAREQELSWLCMTTFMEMTAKKTIDMINIVDIDVAHWHYLT